jgi:signal transduction histidine kinase
MNEGDSDAEVERYLRTAFLERVAHELRGPAGVIQGALQELELALGQETEGHQRLFAMARRGVQRIVRSADRLQQTALCERGAVPIQLSSCDLAALVRKAVAEAEALEGRRKIVVDLDVPSDPVPCRLDTHWVSVALYEVASNAIRHAREHVHVGLTGRGAQLQVLFRDDNAARAKFAPARFTPPSEARGLGLALAIVRDVIEAHGGHLEIDAGPSAVESLGSEVRLYFPQSERAVPSA